MLGLLCWVWSVWCKYIHHAYNNPDIFSFMLYLILLAQIFEGSWDSNTPVTHYFYAPVVAKYVRIIPQTWSGVIAMRFELLGCKSKYTQYYEEYLSLRNDSVNASNSI